MNPRLVEATPVNFFGLKFNPTHTKKKKKSGGAKFLDAPPSFYLSIFYFSNEAFVVPQIFSAIAQRKPLVVSPV